ncbi:MAG: endonuclease [Bacilli bacterium]|nr:endonuclease [Bacilli bacterium]
MRKNISGILLSLLALTISGCTTTPKKKPRKNSSSSLTSEISSSSAGVSSSGVGPTSAGASSSSEPAPTSQTSELPPALSSSTPAPTSATSVIPPAPSSSSTPAPTSASSVIPPAPSSSSVVPPQPSSSSTPIPTSSSSVDPVVDTYYASVKDTDSGETLRNKLNGIIKNGHTKIAYKSLADCMTYTDRDWNKSPDKNDTNPYMHIIYLHDNEEKPYTRNDYTDVWDKEHIWAKSNGSFSDDSYYSYSDLHHLRASDKNNNGTRSNYCFNNLSTSQSGVTYVKDGNGDNSGLLLPNACYMPQACDRGDVARALFYMATRYADGSDTNCPLYLSFEDTNNNSGGWWGHLDVLLQWHQEDPVDEFEKRRNDLIFTDFQHNRNPFIDHPEYAARIWSK